MPVYSDGLCTSNVLLQQSQYSGTQSLLEFYIAVFKFMFGEPRQVLKDPCGASSGLLKWSSLQCMEN